MVVHQTSLHLVTFIEDVQDRAQTACPSLTSSFDSTIPPNIARGVRGELEAEEEVDRQPLLNLNPICLAFPLTKRRVGDSESTMMASRGVKRSSTGSGRRTTSIEGRAERKPSMASRENRFESRDVVLDSLGGEGGVLARRRR